MTRDRHLPPGTDRLAPGTWHRAPGTLIHDPRTRLPRHDLLLKGGSRSQVPGEGSCYPVPSTRYTVSVLGTRYPVPGTRCRRSTPIWEIRLVGGIASACRPSRPQTPERRWRSDRPDPLRARGTPSERGQTWGPRVEFGGVGEPPEPRPLPPRQSFPNEPALKGAREQ